MVLAIKIARNLDDRLAHLGIGAENHVVDPGEKWTFTCSKTFDSAGTFPNIVTATAIDTVDHKPVPTLTARAQVVVRYGAAIVGGAAGTDQCHGAIVIAWIFRRPG